MENPLVSIIVITYNSAEFVLETLESAKAQTYQNIELIISDDGSKDDTVEICEKWLESNKKYFVQAVLKIVESNTGITANLNRGLKAAKGKWVKIIAGDDLLMNNTIESYLKFVEKTFANFVFAKSLGFYGSISNNDFGTYTYPGYNKFFNLKENQQYSMLLRRNYCDGPTFFFNRELLLNMGGFDERFKYEDHPIALKIAKQRYELHYLDKFTVYYRENIPSITRVNDGKLFTNFYKEVEKFNQSEIYPNCNFFIYFFKKYEYYRLELFNLLGMNKRSKLNKFLFLVSYYTNPLNVYNKYF